VLDFQWIFYKIKPRQRSVPTELHITPEKPDTCCSRRGWLHCN